MRPVTHWLSLTMMTLLFSGVVSAQQRSNGGDDRGYDTAIGIGFGIDKVNFDDRTQSRGVTYFTGNFRFNFWSDDDDLRPGQRPSRLKGYLEAEVGYWNDDGIAPFQSDLLVGINAIGNGHAGTVDIFFGGGFGYHFFGSRVSSDLEDVVAVDDGAVGANMQFGVDLNFSETMAFFALGRYDILAGDTYDFQTKILGGLRVKF